MKRNIPLSKTNFATILYLVVALCLLGFSSTMKAQPKLPHEEMYFGAQGGVVASMVQFAPVVQQRFTQPFLGVNAGLVYRYIGHKVCGLQVEVNYMQRGWNESLTGYQREIDYIEVPLLMHLYFGRKVRGFLHLGPQFGYAFRDVVRQTGDVQMTEGENTSKYQHQYAPIEKPFDWGVAGGVGCYYRSRYAGTYQIEARFNYSLGPLFSTSRMDYFTTASHMNLSLNFAYMWQIKGDK